MEHASLSFEERPAAQKRLGVVALVFATRLVCALLVAWPFASLFGRAVGAFPRGDLLLFDSGGLFLIETMRRSREAMAPISTGALLLVVTFSVLGLLPLAALLGALSVKGRLAARDLGAFAFRPLGVFALLLVVFVVAQGVLGGVIVAIGGAVARRSGAPDPTADFVKIGFAALALLVVVLVGAVHDLARAAAVRGDLGFRASLRTALATVRQSPVSLLLGFAIRASMGIALLAAGLLIGSKLGVERARLVFVGFLVHQGAVFGALFFRASWLAKALVGVSLKLTPLAESAVALAFSATAVDASEANEAALLLDLPDAAPSAESAPLPAEPAEAGEPASPQEKPSEPAEGSVENDAELAPEKKVATDDENES